MFLLYLEQLFTADTRVGRHFAPKPKAPTDDEEV